MGEGTHRGATRLRRVGGFLLLAAALVAGCGDGSEHASTQAAGAATRQAPVTRPITTPAGPGGVDLVNSVCLTVRQGAPAPLAPPFTAARITRYVEAARPVTRRVEVSLRRLSASGAAPRAGELAKQVGELRRVYSATAAAVRDARAVSAAGLQIAAHEGAVNALARESGFPACAAG